MFGLWEADSSSGFASRHRVLTPVADPPSVEGDSMSKVIKPASKGKAPASSATASVIGTRRPGYVIVFRERSEANTGVLSKVLKVGAAKGIAARAGRAVLSSNHEWAAQPRVYERMGIAVADLDAEERAELEKDEHVAVVAKNEVRSLPPIIEYDEQKEMAGPVALPSLPLAGLTRRQVELEGASWMKAYATGVRDTADLFVQLLSSGADGNAVQAVASTPRLSWALRILGLDENYSRATGAEVRVAVLDTGVDLEHPDFAGRIADSASFVPGETVQDGNGHGTHCAGVIGARRDPLGGRRYSVAPDVELLIGKVLDNSGNGYDDQILEGIDWAADLGARVISMSLGSPRNVGAPFSAAYELVAATRLAEASGVLIVAATSNESERPYRRAAVGNPAACPSILSVAAIDRYRRVGYFSCAQLDSIGKVDVSGPGVGVYSSWTGGGYKAISGTSMATPHAAGVCALLLELENKLTPRQLWSKLVGTCRALGDPTDFGAGLIQVP
jgi:subtilisin family serine protease